MKTLILMRHAKSDWSKPGQNDHARSLNPRGRLAAVLMGAWLRETEHVPETALVSSATRTRETFARLGFKIEPDFQDALYHASPDDLLDAVRRAPDCKTLLVLGHNPGMEAAMGLMAGGKRLSAPTCATGVYALAIKTWRDATFDAGKMRAFETPKSLV